MQLLDGLDDIAAARRTHLADVADHAVGLLRRDLPDWHVTAPSGGAVLWAELPIPDTSAYTLLARRHGVHIAPGSIATPTREPDSHVRICIDRPKPLVEEGIRRLGLAWRELRTERHNTLG